MVVFSPALPPHDIQQISILKQAGEILIVVVDVYLHEYVLLIVWIWVTWFFTNDVVAIWSLFDVVSGVLTVLIPNHVLSLFSNPTFELK